MTGGELRHVVGLQVLSDIAEGSSDDLLDLSRMQVNAWSEFGHFYRIIKVATAFEGDRLEYDSPSFRQPLEGLISLSHVTFELSAAPKKKVEEAHQASAVVQFQFHILHT